MNQHTMVKNALSISTAFLLPVIVAGNCESAKKSETTHNTVVPEVRSAAKKSKTTHNTVVPEVRSAAKKSETGQLVKPSKQEEKRGRLLYEAYCKEKKVAESSGTAQESKKAQLEAIHPKWSPAVESIISLASKIIKERRGPSQNEREALIKKLSVVEALLAEIYALKASKQEEESWFESVHRQEQDLYKQYGISEKQVDNFMNQYIRSSLSSVAKKRDGAALESVRRDMLKLQEEIVSIVSKIINENRASTTEEETTLKRKLAYEKFQRGKFIYWGSSRGEQKDFSIDAQILEDMFCKNSGITRKQYVDFMKIKGLVPSCA